MSRLSCKFDEKAIGKPQCGSPPKRLKCRRHRGRFLKREVLMVQEHLDRPSDLSRVALVYRHQHPHSFSERQDRHPGTVLHERVGSMRCWAASSLSGILLV